jgi:hypothetical protein
MTAVVPTNEETAVDAGLVKAIAQLVDGDGWALADLLAERFPEDDWGDAGSHGRNGLYVEMRRYENAIAREYGVLITSAVLRQYRATSLAWPDEARASSASFAVHARMRGPARFAEMQKRLRQAAKEKRALSVRMLSRYRAEENPKPARQYDERLRATIAAAVRKEMLAGYGMTTVKEWWRLEDIIPSMTGDAARQARSIAARELRALANAITKADE